MKEKYLKAIVGLSNLNDKTEFKRYQAHESISDIVDLFWSVAWCFDDQTSFDQKIIPNPHVNIVVYGDGTYVEGPIKDCFSYHLKGSGIIFGVKFRVGAFNSLYKGDIDQLTNKKVPIDQLLPAWSKLNDLVTVDEKIAYINNELVGQAKSDKQVIAEKIVDYIKDNKDLHKIKVLHKVFDISERGLQRLFKTYVGVNPKWVIRVYRLQELKSAIENKTEINWLDLAYQLDYSDQSHMINDFKSIFGMTPNEFRMKVK